MFKDTSVAFDISPDKRKSVSRKSGALGSSPMRASTTSRMMGSSTSQMGMSPRGQGMFLDMHKKTGVELRSSPSKNSKIVMRYINNYQDVGPVV